MPEDDSIPALRRAVEELHSAIAFIRNQHVTWQPPPSQTLPVGIDSWNFTTFEKFINQRFADFSLQLRERYEAQQTGLAAALAAAEKAVHAALIAAEKAVDKAEGAQQLRNEAQNEFRKSLSDLSGLMWTIKEGQATVDSLRREVGARQTATEERIEQVVASRVEATDTLRKSLESRISALENGHANIMGRIWAISALFAILTLLATLGFKLAGGITPVTSYVPAPTASAPAPTAPAPIVSPR